MLIPEHKIEEVLERTDLVALVSRHVELKKSGRSFKGRCPFHQEKSASFYVTPEMRRFKCFGCQAGGDAIAFVQRYLGKTFVDAVRDLAREAGVDIEAAVDPSAKERQQLKDATDVAAEHFKQNLWHPEKGKQARDYLRSRGVTEELVKAFGLGWAMPAWSDLADKLREAGVLDFAERAGLVGRRQRSDGFYDMFRGRVIIPIRSPEGRTIAFGGRLLVGDDGPKYLNSRESKLYNKSETLYGMDQARDEIRRRKSAVLVEGYFDCIGLHQAGVKHAVALCSTALTPGHLGVLHRAEAKELILLLDGDEAGRKAVERLAGALIAGGTSTRVALLPEGQDPDTFARDHGQAGMDRLLAEAQPLTTHLFRVILPGAAGSAFEDKMKAVDRMRPITTQLPVGLTRSAFFAAMSAHFGLPAAELELALRGKSAPVQPVPKPGLNGTRADPAQRPALRTVERPPERFDALYVAALLREPKLGTVDVYRVGDEISHPGLRALLGRLRSAASPEEALFEASETVKRRLEEAARELPREDSGLELAFAAVCRKVKLRRIEEQLTYMSKVTAQTQQLSELSDDVRELLSQRSALVALQSKLKEEDRRRIAGTKKAGDPV